MLVYLKILSRQNIFPAKNKIIRLICGPEIRDELKVRNNISYSRLPLSPRTKLSVPLAPIQAE